MSQVRKDVLNGWKEIAAYLGRDPRTVERWEKQRQLPVRRMPGGGRASVYALITELDAWLARPPAEVPSPAPASDTTPPAKAAESGPKSAGPILPGAVLSGSEGKWRSWEEAEPRSAEPGQPHRLMAGVAAPEKTLFRRGWLAVSLCAALALPFVGWRLLRQRRPLSLTAASKVDVVERVRTLRPSSKIPGVENLYLEGCYEAELRTPNQLQRAQASFSKAIAMDPDYAPAYSGLASTFLLLREYAMLSDEEAYEGALRAADHALRLDPEFPQAHAVEGFVDFFWKWDAPEATREFEAAEQLEPTLPLAHHWYGSMLVHEGRFAEALHELQIAQKLDPSSSAILTMRAYALGLSGHREEGKDLLRNAIATERPGQFRWPATMHQVLGVLSLMPPRDLPRYLSETMIAADLRHDSQTVREMRAGTEAFRSGGESAMWRVLLAGEQKAHKERPVTYAAARYKAALGRTQEALQDLQSLYEHHDPAVIGVSIDPLFKGLHTQVRFGALRRELGLPEMP